MDKMTKAREDIINNAKYLFREKGYNRTSMDDIAEMCDVSKSLVKYYFPRKKDIAYIIMHDHLENIRSYLKKNVDVSDALVYYILTMKLYYEDIYDNEPVHRFNSEALLITQGTDASTGNNMDEIYREIIAQFNINLTSKMFEIRKVQMLGAQVFLLEAAAKEDSGITDRDRFEAAIYSTVTLLGVSSYYYNKALSTAYEIYSSREWEHFSML